jgi:hypothetical protein
MAGYNNCRLPRVKINSFDFPEPVEGPAPGEPELVAKFKLYLFEILDLISEIRLSF